MNVLDLRGLFFLDTNVFVYSFDDTTPQKQQMSRRLIRDALGTQRGVISTQVVQEFLNVALRKFVHPMTVAESRDYMQVTLLPIVPTLSIRAFLRPCPLAQRSNRVLFLRFPHRGRGD